MRIKRLLAAMTACLMLTACAATTAFAYTGNDTDAAATEATSETETEAAIDRSGSTTVLESESEAETATGEGTDTADTTGDTSATSSYNMTVAEDGTITFTYGGQEYSINPSDLSEATSTGTVVNVNSYLNLRAGSGTDNEVIGHLLPGTQVEVTGEENGWYKVTVSEQTGYVYGDYLAVTEDAENGDNAELLTALLSMMAQGLNSTDATSTGLTPDGNLTLVDDIGSTTESGQQFITLVTKAGNTFYLVIDRDDDGNENVHFLNLVDEADLFALLDEDAQAAYESEQAAENTEGTETSSDSEAEETADPDETTEPETEKTSISLAPLMLLVLVMFGGIGGFLYVTITKKKKQAEAAKPDPDADYEDEDGEEYELPEDTDEDEADDDSQIYSDDSESGEDYPETDETDNEPV